MAGRPRKPLALVKAEGRDVVNAGRFQDRAEVDEGSPLLGEAPEWIQDTDECRGREAWDLFRSEAPWLKACHTFLVGAACQIQGRIMAMEPLDIKEINALRGMLSEMGLTPVTATKVMAPTEADKKPGNSFLAPRAKKSAG
ncbi:terminase small subunit protein [Rhizobium phage RHph_X2_26]|nr:terminase small subunit protein [Rhizobium phage RHph_X2_26]